MTLSEKSKARLDLAHKLRENADHSSEAEIRSALSRSYYSVFHAAQVLLSNVTHDNVAEKLGSVNVSWGHQVKNTQRLRMKADYDPHLINREYAGDVELFRRKSREEIDSGSLLFQHLLLEIERTFPNG